VSTGGFSPEARMEARTHRTHSLTLIDLQELVVFVVSLLRVYRTERQALSPA
jgi:hypothetical protein